MTRYAWILVLGSLVLTTAACQPKPAGPSDETGQAEPKPAPMAEPAAPAQAMAVAHLQPAEASSGISGTVTFSQEEGGVHVHAVVSGLTPGKHGLHIHVKGECVPPFTSAGDHLNPYDYDHGCPPANIRHLGDLGNVEVGPDGKGTYDQVVDKISLVDPEHQIEGRSLILHEGEDDCKTQPSGNSGARIACGVIEAAPAGAGDQAQASPEGAGAAPAQHS